MSKSCGIFLFLLLLNTLCFSQQMRISGAIQDTVNNAPLPYASVLVIKIKDSTLVAFTRSDAKGHFELNKLQVDTVEVIISSPTFGQKSLYIVGSANNAVFELGKIILPPKNQQLQEVIIYAFKDPVYYKGDTLVYTADSFKVRPNATVEDLLKKLPGIKVDQSGKIMSQGKAIDKLLVDGDEFFGSDPTLATRNLDATAVESVQVFEKKDETNSAGENIQVMNLKLKSDAKKGYFGKMSAATDAKRFYEGQLFANNFKGSRKVSVFSLGSNTPSSPLGYSDIWEYGLDNEAPAYDDGYQNGNTAPVGIPKAIQTGIYYADRLGKNTKLNMNYTFNSAKLKAESASRSTYFIKDSSYSTMSKSNSVSQATSHSINLKIVQTLDSLTELEIEPKLKLNKDDKKNQFQTSFYTQQGALKHASNVSNSTIADGYTLNTFLKLTRKFVKKDREIRLNYNYSINDVGSDGVLKADNTGVDTLIDKNTNQQKTTALNTQNQDIVLVYKEPLTKKIKLEFEYNLNYNRSKQDKHANDFLTSGEWVANPKFTNNFENQRWLNSGGVKFIYEVKKYTVNVGARARTISFTNTDLIEHKQFVYKVDNLLPYLSYFYRINSNSRLNFRYTTTSQQPTIGQLQPIADNTNPNQVTIGNRDLLPAYSHKLNAFYNLYKPLSGKSIWCTVDFTSTDRAFSNAIFTDSLGRTATKTINVDGNYNGNASLYMSAPLFQKIISVDPNLMAYYTKNKNFINGLENITKTTSVDAALQVSLELDTLTFRVNYTYGYNIPSSTLSKGINKPYGTQELEANLYLKLPFKFSVETSADYIVNSNRSVGYNNRYVLWNASISNTFLKNESLILSVSGHDLLNQNIGINRTVQDNVISDVRTTIINRYFLVELSYKFKNKRTKDDENL